jgi:drug/metabolite transporter (DMT)-like permease
MMLAIAPVLFVLLWSSGFVAAKLAVPFAEPCTFLAMRFAMVVALLAPFAVADRASWLSQPARLVHSGIAGASMQGVYLSCVVWSIYLGMPAGVVALVVILHPRYSPISSSVNASRLSGGPAFASASSAPHLCCGRSSTSARAGSVPRPSHSA